MCFTQTLIAVMKYGKFHRCSSGSSVSTLSGAVK